MLFGLWKNNLPKIPWNKDVCFFTGRELKEPATEVSPDSNKKEPDELNLPSKKNVPPFWNAAFLIMLSILPKEMAAHK